MNPLYQYIIYAILVFIIIGILSFKLYKIYQERGNIKLSKKLGENFNFFSKEPKKIDDEEVTGIGMGVGPVNALDNAIRQNVDRLAKYSIYLKDLKLVDYKVRILNTGTEAVTRVSIESTYSKGKNWFTIGVSTNIIDASFKALIDSLDYKLFKDNAPASK